MSSSTPSLAVDPRPAERLEVLFEELAELAGQRNAIDGRVVEIAAELGVSPTNANMIATVGHRLHEFPRCTQRLREGQLSLDQVGVIAGRAANGSDEHYAQLAASATVSQLRTAVKLEPRSEPGPRPGPRRCITKTGDEESTSWRITLPHAEAATFDAALASHLDGLIADWKRDHDNGDRASEQAPPLPNSVDAFLHLIEAGWDTEVARRPHGQRTTVAMHVDVGEKAASLHLGPALSEGERRYLLCDATCEVWFRRNGHVIGSGRSTRTVGRRLRRALEHRDQCCVVPGCGATAGLHAHHIRHWEDGGPTDLWNLVLLCPYHHRSHHSGIITITGDAHNLTVTDSSGQPLSARSLARPPTTHPPAVNPYSGPTGERAHWWWYQPFQPHPPPSIN